MEVIRTNGTTYQIPKPSQTALRLHRAADSALSEFLRRQFPSIILDHFWGVSRESYSQLIGKRRLCRLCRRGVQNSRKEIDRHEGSKEHWEHVVGYVMKFIPMDSPSWVNLEALHFHLCFLCPIQSCSRSLPYRGECINLHLNSEKHSQEDIDDALNKQHSFYGEKFWLVYDKRKHLALVFESPHGKLPSVVNAQPLEIVDHISRIEARSGPTSYCPFPHHHGSCRPAQFDAESAGSCGPFKLHDPSSASILPEYTPSIPALSLGHLGHELYTNLTTEQPSSHGTHWQVINTKPFHTPPPPAWPFTGASLSRLDNIYSTPTHWVPPLPTIPESTERAEPINDVASMTASLSIASPDVPGSYPYQPGELLTLSPLPNSYQPDFGSWDWIEDYLIDPIYSLDTTSAHNQCYPLNTPREY